MSRAKVLVFAMCEMALLGCQTTTQSTTSTHPTGSSVVDRSNFVYVSNSTPSAEASALGRLNREGVEKRVAGQRKQAQSLKAKNGPQSVVFVLYSDIPVGARIVTSYTYSRAADSIGSEPTDKPFTERFQYVVLDSTPIEPLLIVNELFSVFKGTFVLEAEVNGRRVLRSVVPVTNDLAGLRRQQ